MLPVNAEGISMERSRKGSSVLLSELQVRHVTQDWRVPPNTAVTTELDWDLSILILWSTHGSRCSSSV